MAGNAVSACHVIDSQRLRNLTTGKLHTDIGCVYEDLEWITGERGLMTHMLPRVMKAVTPWLKEHVVLPRYWDGEYDPSHCGGYLLPEPSSDDRADMLARFQAMPSPFEASHGRP